MGTYRHDSFPRGIAATPVRRQHLHLPWLLWAPDGEPQWMGGTRSSAFFSAATDYYAPAIGRTPARCEEALRPITVRQRRCSVEPEVC